jgi:hypothetical protein
MDTIFYFRRVSTKAGQAQTRRSARFGASVGSQRCSTGRIQRAFRRN